MHLKKTPPPVHSIPLEKLKIHIAEITKKIRKARSKKTFLLRAAIIYYLLEKFSYDSSIEHKITLCFAGVIKDDFKNIKDVHLSRLSDKKYKEYLYFWEQIKAPTKEVIEAQKPTIIKKSRQPEEIVLTKEEIDYANKIENSIFNDMGVDSLEKLKKILNSSELKSYRTIALLNFLQKYPATPQSKIYLLFKKLEIKDKISTLIKRHQGLLHRINNYDKFSLWHRQAYATLSAQIKTATSNE